MLNKTFIDDIYLWGSKLTGLIFFTQIQLFLTSTHYYSVRRYKKNFEIKLAKDIKTNPKSFYSYVRSKSKTKDRVGPLIDDKNNTVTNDVEMCKMFNDYFSSVFTDESLHPTLPIIQDLFKDDCSKMLLDVHVSEAVVFNRLKKLKLNKAPGVDNIAPKVLIETAEFISKPLSVIFNKSLSTGVVPNDWKKANVSVIFKKGTKHSPCNYRPISLTSQVCKVLESEIREQIVVHLVKFNLIKDSQHGFVKNRSCLTNLLEYLSFVSEYVDKGVPVDVIYLDFQKAFDKVPHKRLISKVCAHGVQGNISKWIESWLSDREQRVVLSGSFSEWTRVTSGVAQGSVLGPLLFILYINDIDDSVSSRLLKFADDTKVFRNVSKAEDVDSLRQDLVNLYKWSVEWLMLFNVDKCKVMHFGYKNINAEYSMGGNILDVVKEERDLGVIVQSDLKVSQQCSNSVKTANKILGMINRNFCNKTEEIILSLYKSLVRPHLEYCVQAWRPHLVKDIELLESVQRRATRMIPSLKGLTYSQRLEALNLTSLETRRLRGDLIEVYKIVKGFDDINSSKFFKFSETNLRGHDLKLYKSRFNTNIGKFAFSNRIVDEWNLLSLGIISSNTVLNFKIKLDQYFKNRLGFI